MDVRSARHIGKKRAINEAPHGTRKFCRRKLRGSGGYLEHHVGRSLGRAADVSEARLAANLR